MVNFFEERTVRWDDGRVVMIDQRRLPNRLTYLICRNYQEVAEAIRTMAVRGAPAIGVAAAYGIVLAAQTHRGGQRSELMTRLKAAGEELKSTRPTAVNLFWAVDRILRKAEATAGSTDHLKRALLDEAEAMAEEDIRANREMGMIGAELISDGDRVLTHCKWPAKPAECG